MKTAITILCIFFVLGCVGSLHQAIQKNDDQQVADLIARKTEVNRRDDQGNTPLHLAVKKNNLTIVEMLLHAGADPRLKNRSGWTPLHVAAYHGYDEIAALLLKAGAQLQAETNSGNTPVALAIKQDHLSTVKVFCTEAGQVTFANTKQTTALHVAAEYGKVEIAAYLVENGAEVKARNHFSRTPLHCALYHDNLALARYLVERGAKASMIGINVSDLYATAKEYEIFGDTCLEKRSVPGAILHYRIAMDYYEKAAINFNNIAEELDKKATRRKWKNALSYIGAMAQAYGSAATSVAGYGSGVYTVSDTVTFEELAGKYRAKAANCHACALKCFERLTNPENGLAGKDMLNGSTGRQLSETQTAEAFERYQTVNFKAYCRSEPYQRFVEDIVARSEDKALARFVIPTYQAMRAGLYEGIEDANVALASKGSPEMFVQAWRNTPQFVAMYHLVATAQDMGEDEFLVAMTDASLLTNKRLFLIDHDRGAAVIALSDLNKIEEKVGLVTVETAFVLKSGATIRTDQKVPKPVYLEKFKTLLAPQP